MDLPSKNSHAVCDSFQQYLLKAMNSSAARCYTCLSDDSDSLCQRYPNLGSLIREICGDAEAFIQALSLASVPVPEREQELPPTDGRVDDMCVDSREELAVTVLEPTPTQAEDTLPTEVSDHEQMPSNEDLAGEAVENAQIRRDNGVQAINKSPSAAGATIEAMAKDLRARGPFQPE
ncbi:uncharacterized protein PV06_11862 [Exophiala oligosperma]|uniref:Uncharacterized protein n=1 Tax=Exophiala oligosperma TaxID=215243 RepID=A0A0D2CXJ3_9EURO|nr:uncharacterized protein PV06_11862 [Exophiala oligosperma]KIW35798.1 hypothetical protein PV06_11862 [Exophiala oligosperma]